MKLMIAVDMEGATGVFSWEHVDPKTAEYQRFRRLLTADVNAAIEGALAEGVGDIVVTDGHWNSGNVLIEDLNPHARLNGGTPSPFSMVQGAQEGIDAVFFVGYHARMGTASAILDHTWSASKVANVWLNGRVVGETGLNGAVCGEFGAPVLLITGDQAVAAEAQDWIPGIETAIVKIACGRCAARCLPPDQAQAVIRSAAQRAVKRFLTGQGPAPMQVAKPTKIRIEFANSQLGDMACLLPGAVRLDGRTIEFEAPDVSAAYLGFRAAVALAGT
jgi:D-amino peptidase